MKAMFFAICAVAGLMACSGAALAHDMDGRYGSGSGVMHHGMGCASLSPEKEKMVHQAMHASMEKNRPLWKQMRGLHEKMHGIIMAQKFNRKAFLGTVGQMTRLHDQMERNRALAMASVAGKLSPGERMSAAKLWMAGGPHGGFHHGPHGDKSFHADHNAPAGRYHEDDYHSFNN